MRIGLTIRVRMKLVLWRDRGCAVDVHDRQESLGGRSNGRRLRKRTTTPRHRTIDRSDRSQRLALKGEKRLNS